MDLPAYPGLIILESTWSAHVRWNSSVPRKILWKCRFQMQHLLPFITKAKCNTSYLTMGHNMWSVTLKSGRGNGILPDFSTLKFFSVKEGTGFEVFSGMDSTLKRFIQRRMTHNKSLFWHIIFIPQHLGTPQRYTLVWRISTTPITVLHCLLCVEEDSKWKLAESKGGVAFSVEFTQAL